MAQHKSLTAFTEKAPHNILQSSFPPLQVLVINLQIGNLSSLGKRVPSPPAPGKSLALGVARAMLLGIASPLPGHPLPAPALLLGHGEASSPWHAAHPAQYGPAVSMERLIIDGPPSLGALQSSGSAA